ncbi:Lauroyl/myristoyl acyltransferase [Halobacteroides halobius DSM 5150]|uniref:Lauroyl/myristoyl acyltransferase n=1 Tax=Halobacteroides halobius (strain ATCC 35273 / DSM 5150 / MD-1) TaxID=748449 RepID=L0KD58_HALHC|nr:lysophospholipid acyltransferase family protein [Halobacteroides halobius]AGB42289.1 Lauroyl/myristoyl acyltransferase [Halobacteroides halobius DSM 5150]
MQKRLKYYIFRFGKWLAKVLPIQVSYYLASGLGNLLFYLVKDRRELGIKNIKLALDYSQEEAYKLTKDVFKELAFKFIEIFRLEKWNKEDFNHRITVEGLDNLEKAYEQGQGIVLFTGHLGNWELLGIYLSWLGYPVNAIAKEQRSDLITEELWQLREIHGAKIFNRKQVKSSFKALLKKELLVILGDQDAHQAGEFVQFFHRLASTPKGPAVLAQKAQSLILPIYMIREGIDNYSLVVEEPLQLTQDASRDERKKVLQKLTTSLEEKIREYPDQWLWLHRRWKTDPSKEDEQ